MLILVTERAPLYAELIGKLNAKGIFLYRCPYDAAEKICDRKDTGGVLLDFGSHQKECEQLYRALLRTYPDMPIAAIVPKNSFPDMPAARLIREGALGDIFCQVLDFCICNCGFRTATLSTFYLTVSDDPASTRYMGYPLPLSPREHRILRCLFYRAPHLTSTDDLMTLCYPEGTQRVANLAVQIRDINRRAARIDPAPLILNVYGKGYRLRDGIL